ncbi:MAG: IMS domain-containing protein [Cyanobacteria bacterium P01_A01_bin.45]
MRIGLDYYRILGLPLAASDEQLRQAYSDRIVQLPRSEYSQAAIDSRKQVIEEAYVVLSDPKERKAYDRLYLSRAYYPESGNDASISSIAIQERVEGSGNQEFDQQALSIDIPEDRLVGALLVLQELGEYEQVLKLGQPYLLNRAKAKLFSPEAGWENSERLDILLTVALACLELGREQWQQSNYENAAASLQTGLEMLAREDAFPNLQGEIQADLYRLQPYRILELLALPIEENAQRQQGIQLLQEVLEQRGGIDGNGDDRSGLSIDDFLRFIQQIRHYLTVAEQHKLFEQESKRPSAVAIYLAVYALIARGFTQRQPALIRQAKKMLIHLGKRQDVHLEQSLCALLLGRTEEATYALELSGEYEALAFIREKSQDSPDLLLGLCLYGERWLQNEVFSHFRDLAKQSASLKDYFADEQVQAYLEALPPDRETNSGHNQARNSHSNGIRTNTTRQDFSENQKLSDTDVDRNRGVITSETAKKYEGFKPSVSQVTSSFTPANYEETTTSKTESFSDNKSRGENRKNNFANRADLPLPQRVPRGSQRHAQNPDAEQVLENRQGASYRQRRYSNRYPRLTSNSIRSLVIALIGLLLFWIVGSAAFGWLRSTLSPSSELQGEQLAIQLEKPPIEIPDKNSKPLLTQGSITKEKAEEVIENWLYTKKAALGENHDIESLEQILTGSSLSNWRLIAQRDKAQDAHRVFEHKLDTNNLEIKKIGERSAFVTASVNEKATFYKNSQVNLDSSYKQVIRVKYSLIREEDSWLIHDMAVINVQNN